jgi:hypothetical protein
MHVTTCRHLPAAQGLPNVHHYGEQLLVIASAARRCRTHPATQESLNISMLQNISSSQHYLLDMSCQVFSATHSG